MAWKAVARSAIGTSHQKQQVPCQDYGGYKLLNNVIIGAVADGAGSAKYANVGAKLAVETVITYLARLQARLQKRKPNCEALKQPISGEEANKRFVKIVKKVVATLQKQATSNSYAMKDLACTLLVFVATPYWIAAMQIGDGFIVVHSQGGDYQMLFLPHKGEFINQTTFVTSKNALREMQVVVLHRKQEFICAATDGLERVAIDMSNWTAFPPFFKPLLEYLEETSEPEQEDVYITSFLNSARLNERTDDDKTLLLCLFNHQ